MWISRQLSGQGAGGDNPVQLGDVTGGDSVQGISEYRSLPLAAPWGIAWRPPPGAKAVVVSGKDGDVCAGTIVPQDGLEPGELLLYSAGGARILLKNNGEVVVNGQSFPKGGV